MKKEKATPIYKKARQQAFKDVEKVIEGLQRWKEIELNIGVGMKKDKKGYFIDYYELKKELKRGK